MAYDKVAAQALSNNWRVYCLTLDNLSRQELVASMTAATSVKSERNVRLWFDTGNGFRNILNRTLSSDEYELRERIIKGCLRINNENVPLKSTGSVSTRKANADKFAKYCKDPYTGRFTRAIEFIPTGFVLQYDTYGLAVDDLDPDDDDLLEFTDTSLISDDFLIDYF
jgi:hypothetical protein